jgi:prolipoprotein diacylglyceryltransferase
MYQKLFEIPFLHRPLYSFGLMMVIGFLMAVAIIRRLSRDITPNPQLITNAALYSLIVGVAGARLFYVVHYLDRYRDNLLSIFAIWEGGLELYGGVIPAIIIIAFYLWYHKLPIRRYLDILAIGLMLALVFGRIGCFLNGCCFGKPTDLPWAVRFPYDSFAYQSQVKPNFARNRPRPQLQLPDEHFIYDERSFDIDLKFQSELDNQIISGDLRSRFKNNGVPLSRYAKVSVEQKGIRWLITSREDKFTIAKQDSRVEVQSKIQYLKSYKDLTPRQKEFLRTSDQLRSLPVHPTQLYESSGAAVMCLLLYLFWRRTQNAESSGETNRFLARSGQTFGLMFVLYGITRFFIELLRDDNPFELDGLTISQLVAIAMLAFGIILIVIFQRMKTQQPKERIGDK